jgi:hypothetical protein
VEVDGRLFYQKVYVSQRQASSNGWVNSTLSECDEAYHNTWTLERIFCAGSVMDEDWGTSRKDRWENTKYAFVVVAIMPHNYQV